MTKHFEQLSAEERATIMVMAQEGQSLRAIARTLHRAPSTISREWRRPIAPTAVPGSIGYDAKRAGHAARRCRFKPRRSPKLAVDGVLFGVVEPFLKEGWSPGQIAGAMHMMWPDAPERRVAAETIYTCLYALPRGALRQELIACLRKARSARLPRSRGSDRRGQLTDMVSIHVRPPEVDDRVLPGHWEADFIKGAGNRSAVGVLVERSSRLVLLAKMDDATAASALAGYTLKLNGIAEPMRQSLTYDQGKEMARHAELTAQTGVKVYFCDPHSPWQRGSCENTNGLLRQYLPKGTDLSVYSQEQLDGIAERLNQRPRAIHGYFPPISVYRAMMERLNQPTSAVH
ncbi:MAG: IS30 family transposase [Chromatiaceae bacterium]